MKTRLLLTLAFAAFLFLPLSAEAQSCFGIYCDWLAEDFADVSDWDPNSTANFNSFYDPCLVQYNDMAELQGGEWMETDTFFIDGNIYSATEFSLDFNLYHPDDTDNWYDALKVTVFDHTDNSTETFYVRGSDYDESCDDVPFLLADNYLNHTVSVKFEMGPFASGTFRVDNVSFWQY